MGPSALLIGIAGDTACGKTTFSKRLGTAFGDEFATIISLDDYHRFDRHRCKQEGVTALDPIATNFDLMYSQIRTLKEGQPVNKPVYNHRTGKIDPPKRVEPGKIIVVEGLHTFHDERMRALLDFRIYIDVCDDVKTTWRLSRDVSERGHSYGDVLASIEARKPDFQNFVAPQRQFANMVIKVTSTTPSSRIDKQHPLKFYNMLHAECPMVHNICNPSGDNFLQHRGEAGGIPSVVHRDETGSCYLKLLENFSLVWLWLFVHLCSPKGHALLQQCGGGPSVVHRDQTA